jgi:hypothetical protein
LISSRASIWSSTGRRSSETQNSVSRKYNVIVKSRLVDNYMYQPPALSSGIRISRRLISRVWTLRKVK